MHRTIKYKYNKSVIIALGLALTAFSAQADLLFDRGLPTDNINNAAGSNRSNIAWADSETTGTPSEYWLPGDNFTLGGSGSYLVNTIRVWTIGNSSNLSLLGGLDGNPMSIISTSYSATPVTYSNSLTYQNNAGSFLNLYQVDFAVNLSLNAGDAYDFFVNSPWAFVAENDFRNTPLHSTNAGLSGSTQEEADGVFLWLHVNGATQTVETWDTATGAGTSGFPAGWDKDSDGNVQVFGAAVPEPGSLAILSVGLLLVSSRRSSRRK